MVQFLKGDKEIDRHSSRESKRNRGIAEALKKRPNTWALIASQEPNQGLAHRIRYGRAKSFLTGEWDAMAEPNEDGTFEIYAIYREDN